MICAVAVCFLVAIVDAGLREAVCHALGMLGGTETAEELVADKARHVIDLRVAKLFRRPHSYM
jgi:hypothetical protein